MKAGQGRFVLAVDPRQQSQPASHLLQYAVLGLLQLTRQPFGPLEGLIDYHAAVHDEEYAAGSGPFCWRTVSLAGQGEDRHVDAGGLAGCRRQRQRLRPGSVVPLGLRRPAGQPVLPGEWAVAVEGLEEFAELLWSHPAHSLSPPSHRNGRHIP